MAGGRSCPDLRVNLFRVAWASGEMADAHGSGPCPGNGVGVQLPPRPLWLRQTTKAPQASTAAGPSSCSGSCSGVGELSTFRRLPGPVTGRLASVLGMFGWGARARRDAEAAARVDQLRASASTFGGRVVLILQVYQQVKRGTKAYVQLDGVGWTRDAFFWWVRLEPGSMVVATSSTGWGPHTRREDVLWVGGEHRPAGTGIHAVAPAADVKRWERHHRRVRATV